MTTVETAATAATVAAVVVVAAAEGDLGGEFALRWGSRRVARRYRPGAIGGDGRELVAGGASSEGVAPPPVSLSSVGGVEVGKGEEL